MVEVTQLQDDGFFVLTTREEAMRIIESLAKQILNNNINTGRAEFGKRTGEDVTYFTIGVKEKPRVKPKYNIDDIYAKEDSGLDAPE